MSSLPAPRLQALHRVKIWSLAIGAISLAVCVVGAFWETAFRPPTPGPPSRADLVATQFFRAYLTAYLFFLGIAHGCFVVLMIYYLTGGAWGLLIRRILEAGMRTMPLLAVLFIPVACGVSWLYLWAQPEAVAASKDLQHKAIYLNPTFFWVRAALFFLLWVGTSYLLSRWSVAHDRTEGPRYGRWLTGLSGPGLVMFGIAWLGFLVWAHHMFVAGISTYGAMIFSMLSFLVAVPSAIKVFNWTATLYKGSITFEAPMLYALGFVVMFTAGGLTGLFLASLGMDMHVHDTYFVIGHFHFIMVGGMVMAYMAGLHYWWPKMTGRMYSDWWSRLSASIIFVGFFFTFLPHYILGYAGMPRRYHSYAPMYQVWNVMSSAGASILAIGYMLPLFYLLGSLRWGKPAGANPWGATGLEWQTQSPPSTHNFERTPIVVRGPYDYAEGKAQNER
jgi:hypothetical protein